jgi:protease II
MFGIKNIKTGEYLREKFENTSNIVFNSDNNSLFYLTRDKNFWTNKVYFHKLGDKFEND